MNSNEVQRESPRSSKVFRLFNIIIFICVCYIIGHYLLSAPVNNKIVTIHISSNQTLDSISKDLEDRSVIRSAFVLKSLVTVLNFDRKIASGDYLFESKSSVLRVAWQVAQSRHNVKPIKITFKEGMTNEEIANLLASKLSLFRKDLFLSHPKSKQGYLFPDTYFFFSMATTDEIVSEFSNNFNNRIKSLDNKIKNQNRSLSDIVIMASILEREARGKEDAPIISGILWKRIAIGMPLQVDVERSTYSIKGLPVEPINNPGLISIEAALEPTDSAYLYYLHDKNGIVHFAKSYEEHRKNINNYLK